VSYKLLYDRFRAIGQLPVKVDDIRTHILKLNLQDEINFIPSPLNDKIVLGFVKQYIESKPYSTDPKKITDVYYGESLNFEMQRFVICKEMMHIFDSTDGRTNTKEKLQTLLTELANPPIPEETSQQRIEEAKAIYRALALFCPLERRTEILEKLNKGQISLIAVSHLLRIPASFVESIFSNKFSKIIHKFLEN